MGISAVLLRRDRLAQDSADALGAITLVAGDFTHLFRSMRGKDGADPTAGYRVGHPRPDPLSVRFKREAVALRSAEQRLQARSLLGCDQFGVEVEEVAPRSAIRRGASRRGST